MMKKKKTNLLMADLIKFSSHILELVNSVSPQSYLIVFCMENKSPLLVMITVYSSVS